MSSMATFLLFGDMDAGAWMCWGVDAGGGKNVASVDGDLFGVTELVAAGDDDAVAFLDAVEQFDCADAAGTDADRALDGGVAVHDPGAAAAAFVDERAAFDLQHVLAGVHHDARGQALVLAQTRRVLCHE